MRRPIIIQGLPSVSEPFRKNAQELFAETGGNSGNLAFRYAIAQYLVDPVFMDWQSSPASVKKNGDLIVLPLANQLGAHTDLGEQADRLEAFGLPVVGIGLGAQAPKMGADISLTEGTERWLQTLVKLSPSDAPNLGLRGAYTQAQIALRNFGKSTVITGCPSNFINPSPNLAVMVAAGFARKPRRIAVSAGIPYETHLRDIEINLAQLATGIGGSYVVQHSLEMLRLARGEFGLIKNLDLYRNYIRPDLAPAAFIEWCRDHAIAFYDVPAWMDYLRRFDLLIGTRFHGAMLALQAGVPAVCIAHDSRTHEMCVTMGVPVLFYTEIKEKITRENVFDMFHFNPEDYRARRASLYKNLSGLFKAADLAVRPGFAGLA